MLPSKKINIYPKTDENIIAIIEFYFDEYKEKDIALNKFKETSLTINQI